ncbi:hypothetical protein SAMN05421820_102375 [Pedobacter steynii]|uniref:MFS transporter n=1 Tax=Pedobacter steynii TaxID=430522 RepID=A0A1G9NMP9_9SPHI|nr:DUF5690 family protein [Pedobacter steynii]NQX39253.1 hypothetical protein [Pedobacter steynii]SDL87573.1 hypothetical protein SAMN05421820_102375 [Pedobacter steynii]
MEKISLIKGKLGQMPPAYTALLCAMATFCIYVCTYAFRKGFTAGTYLEHQLLGIDFKVWLVIAQVGGYALSKFIGIRFIAEIQPHGRARAILILLLIAWLSLFGFAVIPAPYSIACLFLNGIPLGLIWGLIFTYIEGRKSAEFIGAVLCTSFIFSSGIIKTIGRFMIIHWSVSEKWMPFMVGLLFVLPLFFFVYLLEQVPPPSAEDIRLRTQRLPMTAKERKAFVKYFLPGLVFNITIYVLLTVMRDFRDNFEVEIWSDFGYKDNLGIYSQIDIPIAIVVLILMSLIMLVKQNFKAFQLAHFSIGLGFLLIGIPTLMFTGGKIPAMTYMYMVTLGLYLAYVPYSIIFFERLIATFRYKSNVGFMIYLADSIGYLGSVFILLFKQFGHTQLSWGSFFVYGAGVVAIIGIIGTGLSYVYFYRKKRRIVMVSEETKPLRVDPIVS